MRNEFVRDGLGQRPELAPRRLQRLRHWAVEAQERGESGGEEKGEKDGEFG